MKYANRKAIIDCGTNTFHLLIVEMKNKGQFETLHQEKIAVKIGKGGMKEKLITQTAKERATKALTYFRQQIDLFNIAPNQIKATATSAFRNATNGKLIAEELRQITGITIKIIDGETEAYLIYKGVSATVSFTQQNSLIIDIGGGSVEFILCNSEGIKWLKSYEIGAQRLIDLFHTVDPITIDTKKELTSYIDQELKELYEQCSEYQPTNIIGASGSFDTLVDIYRYYSDGHKLQHPPLSSTLPYNSTIEIIEGIIKKNRKERLAIPGMITLRVDMIVVASILIQQVLKKTKIKKIKTTTYALKEGVLLS